MSTGTQRRRLSPTSTWRHLRMSFTRPYGLPPCKVIEGLGTRLADSNMHALLRQWHLHTFRYVRLLTLAFAAIACSCNLWYLSISRCICRQDHGRGGQAAGEGGKHILFRRRSNLLVCGQLRNVYKIMEIPWHLSWGVYCRTDGYSVTVIVYVPGF